ncbi:unnamed protein product [Didymodactylos carnosus]|uniref:Dynein axonemal assembly factor 5 TPR repeats domain-containing protein n=1 Tax=Didymodactylos carnosus TaxID=1234261 RepID=A0A8S2W475_9BILA|nr:unnamed protein product [Didymodactylos carnosus]CAF4431146.1 unnamed protein product [Didymodactylos carnosus]
MTTGLITDSEVNRNVVLLTDTSKITRQKALQTLCNDINLFTLDNNCEDVNVKEDYFSKRYLSILESIIKLLNDQAEKNRDLVLTFSTTYLKKCMNKNDTLPILIPALTQRLANNSTFELIESSEEIRLKSIELLLKLCQSCTNDKLVLYLNEYIQILKKTIVDPYPEVRKLSCETASNLAKKCQDKFHLMSEILIKPLIETMKHQHAKVRCEAIKALGMFYSRVF